MFTKLTIYLQNGNENNYHEGGGKFEGRFVKTEFKTITGDIRGHETPLNSV